MSVSRLHWEAYSLYHKGRDSHICFRRNIFIYETFHSHSGLPYMDGFKALIVFFYILSVPNIMPGSHSALALDF